MLNRHYQAELAYLREVGKAFGLAHPAIASMLVERSGDPDVERLLEGFAFLTARIRERLDDAVPEISHGLTELLLPHYLRPVPACTIVEFAAQSKMAKGIVSIPAGSELMSTPVDGTQCTFRTTQDVELLPLVLRESTLTQPSSSIAQLRLCFETTEQGRAVLFRSPLQVFIHGELPLTSLLMLWLTRFCRAVVVVNPGEGEVFRGGPECIRSSAFSPENLLFPWPRTSPLAYARLQEYFTLPQKFLFFDVQGLEGAAERAGDRFDLVFEMERPPPLPARLAADTFRLFCSPAVNLFQTTADPLRQEFPGQEHFVRAAGLDPRHMEVFSVDSVAGLRPGGERVDYAPFSSFSHVGGGANSFFHLRRARSPIDEGTDVTLRLGSPQKVAPQLLEETLSVELTCTNRMLPGKMGLGDICQGTRFTPPGVRFKNILPVTQPIRPPLGSELHWRLLSHLAVNQRSLADAESLRTLAELYNFQVQSDHASARSNALRIQAIRKVQSSSARRLFQGAPIRGVRSTIELDESGFASQGDAFLFGMVLDEMFASSVSINSFHELAVALVPSQVGFSFPPRNGRRVLV